MEGPAERMLRALERDERVAAAPKRQVVPRRNPLRAELVLPLEGRRVRWDPRAANSGGYVEELLADDDVADAWAAEEAATAGTSDEMSMGEEDAGEHVVSGEEGAVAEAAGGALEQSDDSWSAAALEEQWSWGAVDDEWKGFVAPEEPYADGVVAEDEAGLEDALERSRQAALELGERDHNEW